MVTRLKLTSVGGSVGIILPEEMLAALGAKAGDTVFVTRVAGGFLLKAGDPEAADQLEVAARS